MENIEVNGMTHSIEDVARYGYFEGIDEQKQKLCDALSEANKWQERYDLLLHVANESIENLANHIEGLYEDLEADVLFMGTRSSPIELIKDEEVKERYETIIKKLVSLEEKLDEFRFVDASEYPDEAEKEFIP